MGAVRLVDNDDAVEDVLHRRMSMPLPDGKVKPRGGMAMHPDAASTVSSPGFGGET